MALTNSFLVYLMVKLVSWRDNFASKVQVMKVQYNGWFLVFLAVLLALAFTITAAMQIWCVTYKGKHFTGNWAWHIVGVSTDVQCK